MGIREFLTGVVLPTVFFAVVVIVIVIGAIILLPKTGLLKTDFQLRDTIVQECLQSERYTREECIQLAGRK